ncbi:MAG: hypothetical protein H7301_08040 [Cryobacterium sp.]|nr:hypothetical protein [Oligoflexia bacterium]
MSIIGSDYPPSEREKIREAKLEKNMKDVVRKKDADAEKLVANLKDRYESTLERERASDREEREQLKAATYNRSGRNAKNAVEETKAERTRAAAAAANVESKNKDATAQTESYYEERATEAAEKNSHEKEALIENYRKQITEANEKSEDGESPADYRAKVRAEAETAVRMAREDAVATRRQAQSMSDQYEQTLKDRDEKAESHLNNRLYEKDKANQAALANNAESSRNSRALELQPLREQVMETAAQDRDVNHEKNLARQGAVRELESDWNTRYTNQTQTHIAETNKLREEVGDSERAFGEKLGATLKEKDAKMAQAISRQNLESRANQVSQAREYDRSLEHVKLGAAHEQAASAEQLERERSNASERQTRAMEKQATTFQKAMRSQRTSQDAEIKNLERVLNDKNTTADAGEISAAAEQSVRLAVTKQYDKIHQAETDRNSRARDHLQQSFNERLDESRDTGQSKVADLTRKNMLDQTEQRDVFVEHVADVEENKRQMLDLANASNQRMSDESLRTHSRTTGELRRHYEDLIASRDVENSSRMQDVRNQSEFEKRTMRREYQAQTTDLIRDQKKNLTDQKTVSDDQLRDLKAKLDTQSRESDRQMKQVLADQARTYEHRLADLEAQAKDREKVVARNNEEEIDKVKKANALLLSKKG